MSNFNQSQAPEAYPPAGTAFPVEGKPETQSHLVAPPPVGYPAKDGDVQATDDTATDKTRSRGDGFWRGCCAGLCCCCLLDACF